jgi:hypothetical protein
MRDGGRSLNLDPNTPTYMVETQGGAVLWFKNEPYVKPLVGRACLVAHEAVCRGVRKA